MYTSNFDSLVVISDPKLAQQLYKNQANMSHSWDLGMGHFIVRYIGDSMGFSSGAKWTKIRQGLLYLDGRNSQKYLHQDQADF